MTSRSPLWMLAARLPGRRRRERPTTAAANGLGLSLVDLTVGLALGLIAIAAAMAGFFGAVSACDAIVEQVELEIRGRHALAMLAGLIRQSGWPGQTTGGDGLPQDQWPVATGQDDCGRPSPGIPIGCAEHGLAGSDALQLRFGGGGPAAPGDPAWLDGHGPDCSGSGLPARPAPGATASPAIVNLLYVGAASDGEPQLLCRHPTRDARDWVTAGLLRGVESLQLRYGVDDDGDGAIDRFVQARTLWASGASAWRDVLAIQLVLVIRSQRERPAVPYASGTPRAALGMFPDPFPGGIDDDTHHVPTEYPEAARRVFATTIRLRNPDRCRGRAC